MRKLFVLLMCAVTLVASAQNKLLENGVKAATGAAIISVYNGWEKTQQYIRRIQQQQLKTIRQNSEVLIPINNKRQATTLKSATIVKQARTLPYRVQVLRPLPSVFQTIDSLIPHYDRIKQEIIDEKKAVASGDSVMHKTYDPYHLLLLSDIAYLRKNRSSETLFMKRALEDGLNMEIIDKYNKTLEKHLSLFSYLPAKVSYLVKQIVERDFYNRISFIPSEENDTFPLPNDSLTYSMCDKYAPSIKPLAQLTFSPTINTDVDLYKAATDSLIANKISLSDNTETWLFSMLAENLWDNHEYDLLLKYFAAEPLEKYAMQDADVLLILSEAAFYSTREDEWLKYSQQLEELSPAHYELLSKHIYDALFGYILTYPDDTEFIKAFIDGYDDHLDFAYLLITDLCDVVLKNNEFKDNWNWCTLDNLAPTTVPYAKTIVEISDYVKQKYLDDSIISDAITLLGAQFGTLIDSHMQQSESDLIRLTEKWPADGNYDETVDFCIWIGIYRAYIAGHGLDKPKDAIKWLKKYEKLAANPNVDPETRSDFYSYMAECYGKQGKKKQATKYAEMAKQP